MIAVIGVASEGPVRLLLDACAAKGIAVVRFDQRRQDAWSVDYAVGRAHDSVLDNGEGRVPVAAFAGIYLRSMDHRRLPEWAATADREAVETMYGRLWGLLDDEDIPTRVVNVPAIQLSNGSKPYQSIVIRDHGLDIPDTCVTSDEDVARAFIARHGAVVYKSISGTRSIVTEVDEASLARLGRVRLCPVQFQECVRGLNVRVHVVGDRTFATRIDSDAVDYRYAGREGKEASLAPFDLAPDIAGRCVGVAHALALPFAGIDLMMTGDGRTVCFEVNPSPGYSYYESHTGQPISHALADHLEGRRPS